MNARAIIGGALVVVGTAGVILATRRAARANDERAARRLRGIEADWWKRQPQPRRCFRTKTAALREFRDANQDTIAHWGGLDVKSSRGEFDAINTRYLRRLRGKPATTIAQAFWAALPPGGPYCLDDLDLDALNETSPGQHGHGFRLPNWMEDDRIRREEARHYARAA